MAEFLDRTPNPSLPQSFRDVEARAREVLKERGLTDELIEHELNRIQRPEDCYPPWWLEAEPSDGGSAGRRS